MLEDSHVQQSKSIAAIIRNTSDSEKRVLLDWLNEIIGIRNNSLLRKRDKVVKMLGTLRHSAKLLPLIKPLLWENRSKRFKMGVGIAAATATFFPGNVGIATATVGVGVPLWVLSAGGYLAVTGLARELSRHLGAPYQEIIDAEYTVVPHDER
jgi:hypothetical protein